MVRGGAGRNPVPRGASPHFSPSAQEAQLTVRKAVIPVAGFGTRFLPATRSVPKVLIPVLDRPPLHLAVEEAARAGVDHVILVVSPDQQSVADYFTPKPSIEEALERRGNHALLEMMRDIARIADVSCVTQHEQLGLGHAVLMAREAVGDEPFCVLLPDDVIWSDAPTIGSMAEHYHSLGGPVIAVKRVPDEAVPSLGIVDARDASGALSRIVGMVEKPRLEDAPSNLAIIGRYVLPPQIFDALERVAPGAGGEIQLTDAIAALLPTQAAHAYEFPGAHFDVGTPLGLLKASAYDALRRPDTAADFRRWLSETL